MKNTTTISALLGLTQKQMALILQVNPTQYSMYECGQRSLPLKAKQLLAEISGFLKFEDKGATVRRHLIEQEETKMENLEQQLRKNEFELYEMDKKIAAVERKYNSNIDAIGLVDYLTAHPKMKEALDCELLDIIASQAAQGLKKFGLAGLTDLRRKQELLGLEKLLIGSALNKTAKTLQELRA